MKQHEIIKQEGLLVIPSIISEWDNEAVALVEHNEHGEAVAPDDVTAKSYQDVVMCLYSILQCNKGMATGDQFTWKGEPIAFVDGFHVLPMDCSVNRFVAKPVKEGTMCCELCGLTITAPEEGQELCYDCEITVRGSSVRVAPPEPPYNVIEPEPAKPVVTGWGMAPENTSDQGASSLIVIDFDGPETTSVEVI